MQAQLLKDIRETEDKWLYLLHRNCIKQFEHIHLPSHDGEHHLRVWQYAKSLLLQLAKQDISVSSSDIESLIIAVFFHDQGMSISFSRDHGSISRTLCEAYFERTDVPYPAEFEKILQAIGDHDKKDYKEVQASNVFNTQRVLNIADDLDAFGFLGVYRYLEIYLLRNLAVETIPGMVIKNLETRFAHFSEAFRYTSSFLETQQRRFNISFRFFEDMSERFRIEGHDAGSLSGPSGILNIIRYEVMDKKLSLHQVCSKAVSADDLGVRHFFQSMLEEMERR